jgi:F-type H+-transporting ATPase subunit gamma
MTGCADTVRLLPLVLLLLLLPPWLLQTLYNAMLENNCSEHASRMSAMENSSKSAGEILGRLTLQYNRDRQAMITNELIEIISGAAALEESG